MNIWHDIDPALITPDRFMAVIEIKRGGKNKYEMDKATGMLRLDRVLYTSTHYRPIMASFRVHTRMMATRLMCWCSVRKPLSR